MIGTVVEQIAPLRPTNKKKLFIIKFILFIVIRYTFQLSFLNLIVFDIKRSQASYAVSAPVTKCTIKFSYDS